MNKAMIIGHVGGEVVTRNTGSGTAVSNFSVATNERWTDANGNKQERTEWHRVVAWGKLSGVVSNYVSKGRQIFVEGRIQTREWEDKDGNKRRTTEIIANQIELLDKKQQTEDAPDAV